MATSGNESFSLTLDSDELEEMYCEHCEKGFNKYTPAEGFCVDCVEYMCETCLGYHKLYMAAHTLQDRNTMPQDFCFDKCSAHTDQLIKFYCDDCEKVACSQCKSTDHASCTKVSHLPKVVAGIENSKELSHLVQNFDNLSDKIDNIEKNIDSRIQSVSAQETEALSSLSKQKAEILDAQKNTHQQMLDDFDKKMEEAIAKLKEQRRNLLKQTEFQQKTLKDKLNDDECDVIRRVQNVKNSNQTGLNSLKARNMKIKTDTNALSSDIKKQQKIRHRCKLFITMQNAQNYIESISVDVSNIDTNIDVHYDTFSVEPELSVSNRGSDVNEHKCFRFQHLVSSRRERNASYHSEISNKHVLHSSLCFLTEVTLLMSDYEGKCIFVFENIQNSTDSYKIEKMSFKPWAISKIQESKVAVTCPKERVIRIITFSETMSVASTEEINVRAECYGIACSHDNLIVSYYNPAKVQILDMSGNILKSFDKSDDGQSLFGHPLFLALSPDNTNIYVSDIKKHTITSMTFDGKVNVVFNDPQLRGPRQMTVDRSGTVYVCGELSNNVHQLSSDLTKVKILLDRSHGMTTPESVAYNCSIDRLYAGLHTSTIKAFNVSIN